MEQPKLEKVYISADLKEKKRGVAIYIKDTLKSKLIKQDTKGRWICVEALINGRKCLIINVYAPNKNEERSSFKLKKGSSS